MSEHRALWVSTSLETKGGISSYVREMAGMPLWGEWNIRHVATHRDGSKTVKMAAFAQGALLFIVELLRFRPSVIHLHASADASFVRKALLLWMSRPVGTPVVVHMHGSDFQDYYHASSRVVRSMIRATLSRADVVVALGEAWAGRLRDIAPKARVTVIPNAVQLRRRVVQPDAQDPVNVVFLGRIGERKGALRVLEAWAGITGHSPTRPATLTLAGDGEVELARRRITELHVEQTVEVCEWLSQAAVEKLLDDSHVLVLPSRNEGQPMAVLEAMARGLCIVASDVGGLAEMIGNGCGIVVDPDDVAGLTDALRIAIGDDETRVRLGEAAHARIRSQFDVDVVSRRIDALYAELTR